MDTRMNKRFLSEYSLLQTDLPPDITCTLKDEVRMNRYEAHIDGPPNSPYKHGRFCVDIQLSETFGIDPPSIKFKTRIYHPNIDDHGNICLSLLKTGNKGAWTPSWRLANVLVAVQQLMASFNDEDPLMPEIAEQMRSDPDAFARTAAEWTARYATALPDDPDGHIPASQLGASQGSTHVATPSPRRNVSAKSPGRAGATKVDGRSAPAEASASTGTKFKLGISRKSAAVTTTTSESSISMLPPPGHGKPTVSAGVRRLGSCRSRTTTLTKVASSSATGPEPPLSLAPSDSATLESPAESIGITSDDESSGTNALFISKPATTISRSSRSPSSAKSAKGGSLAEILASSTAGHKRPLKLVSRAPSADALSSLRPATESKRRKTPVDKTQLPPPPPSRLSSDESDDLSLLSSWPSDCSGVGGESGVECLLEVDDEKNQASGNYSDSLSESLVGAGSLRVDMRIDLSEGTGASESGLSAPVAADEALPTDVRVAMDEPLAEEAVPLSDMPQPVPALKPAPTPKSKAAAKTVALMVATEAAIAKRTDKGKGKGKAVDYQPPPQSTTSKRECSLSDGQVLTESHFGPLDLGLKPIRVSANRSLMRRKPRKSDDAN